MQKMQHKASVFGPPPGSADPHEFGPIVKGTGGQWRPEVWKDRVGRYFAVITPQRGGGRPVCSGIPWTDCDAAAGSAEKMASVAAGQPF